MRPTSATPWALLLLFALGTTLFTCCDDEIACSDETNYLCPNYDPCWNRRTPVSAAFRFGYYLTDVVAEFNINKPDVLPADYFWEANDTVLVGGLTFEAFDTTAHSYTWTVGTDSRTWNTRRFSLSFDCEDVAGQTIPITLVTSRLLDTACTQIEYLRDTVTRMVTFVKWGANPIRGKYRGVFMEYPQDTLTIEINNPCPVDNCYCVGYDYRLLYENSPQCYPETGGRGVLYRTVITEDIYFYKSEDGCFMFNRPGVYRMGYKDMFIYQGLTNRDSLYISGGAFYNYPDTTVYEQLHFEGKRVN
jgi:hypothetical protein